MAHNQQWDFCKKVKSKFPNNFNNIKVLDIGAFDVNGNEAFLFDDCEFLLRVGASSASPPSSCTS
jgi:hypothetical protein